MGSKLQSSFLVKNSLSSVVCGDIRNIMKRLSDSNDDIVLRHLLEYIGHGKDGSILLLRTCLDFMNLRNGDSHNMHPKPELLAATFHHLLVQENFSTVLNEVLCRVEISEGFLSELSETFQMSVSEKVRFGLAMDDSENLNIQTHGQKFCLHQIENFIEKLSGLESVEEIQKILLFLQRSKNSVKDVDSFLQMLSVDLKAGTAHVLLPLLSNDIRDTRFFSGDGETEFDSLLEEMERKASVPDIMMELGYGCTSGISYCKEILSLFVPLTEATISRILSTVVRTYTGLEDSQSLHSTYLSALGINSNDSTSSSSWNIDVLLTSIRELAPTIDWVLIMENLDHEGFFIPSEDSFVFFMSCYCRACKDPFPLHSVCGSVWENIRGQLSFLRYAVSSPPEMFTFAHSFRQLSETDLQSMHERTIKQSNMAWSSLDLLEVLCLAAEKGHAGAVRAMLEFPLRHFPGILLLGLAKINTAYNLLQNEVSSTVLPIIVVKDEAASIIRQIWLCNSKLISFGFANIMTTDPDFMVKIVDICQELNILTTLLEIIPYGFAIRLSVLGHRKECIDLEKWLDTYICNYGDAFFEECLKFLKGLLFDPSNDLSGNPKGYSNLSSIFMRVLHSNSENVISSHLHEELRALHLPGTSLPDNSSPREIGVSDPQASDAYPSDVEAEANNYFQQIFSGQLTIEAMIQMLAAFKVSSNEREQSIYQCMIQNLFEEYRFLPKYPEKQLKISGTLLGCLIKHKLVTHLYLGVALRGVLDALRKPVDSKLFVYGTKALEQFLDRLTEWPQYCNHILQISHLRSAHPDLLTVIERALVSISVQPDLSLSNVADQPNISTPAPVENLEILGTKAPLPAQISTPPYSQQNIQTVLTEKLKVVTTSTVHSKLFLPSVESTGNLKTLAPQNSPAQLSSGVLPSNRGSASARFGSALNIETLVSAAERRESQLEIPSTEVQDKILFMINNISVSNIETKTKEFNEILIDQYYPWFSQYMVMKRASIEPNFHDLYLKFLDKVNSKILNKEIVKSAYENCKVLLGSDLIKSSSEERSLLKNLGSWLGKFTIGRNQVLRAQEIDPKSLIIEAYEKGLMIAMIPFTSKILEPCHHSLAYRPPNPWTMGILGLLVEIYALPNLKMNLRFDIEVLFKNLCVDMKDVKPTSLLKDRVREVEGNPDFSTKDVGMAHSQIVSEISSGIISTLNQGELQSDMVSPSRPPSGHLNVVQQYPSSIHLSSGPLVEEEKLTSLTVSARILPGQVLSQVSPSPSSYSAGQLPTVIPNIGNHVILNQKLSSLGLHYFQRVVPGAIERALKEVTLPVVQRSVTIAMQTTKELVMKDYAMEADETRIYNAAHLMVASLAGSLAHVTCKEPLRTSISSQLRSSFQGLNIASDLLEQAVPLVMNDNLDLGCAAIEQSAMEKAVHSIDGEIAQLLTLRRKHREGVGPSYFEASMYTQGPMGMVPEALRPRPGHLSHSQQRVYEDFVRFPWQNQPGQSSNMVSGPAATSLGSVSSAMSRGFFPSSVRPNNAALSSGVVAVGQNTVTQSTDITSFESESGSQLLSSRVGQGGGSNVGKLNPSVSSVSIPDTAETVKINMKELASNLMISPSAVPEQLSAITDMMLSTGDVLEEYQNILLKLETLILKDAGDLEIQAVICQIPEAILKCVSRDEAALAVAQKVFKSLYDSPSDRNLVNVQLVLLAAIRDVCKLVVKEVTSWVIYSDEERKFNTNIIVGLIRKDLLNLAEYNVHMAKLMDGGRNKAATNFVISLVELLLLQESRVTLTELPNLVDALSKIAARPGSPESLQHLIEAAKNPNLPSSGHDDKHTRHPKKRVSDRSFADDDGGDDVDDDDDDDDPLGEISVLDLAGFREQVSSLFVEWYQMYEIQNAGEAACSHFILQLQQAGFLNGDDVTDRFFRFLTELSVAHCVSAEGSSQIATFAPVDVYAKLVVQTLKFTETGPSRLTLFAKILSETIRVIQRDTEDNRGSFNPRPYFRLFIDWLFDLVCTDAIFDGAGFQVLVLFANTFHTLQPLKIPAFSFAWLELVSHRTFMPKLLLMTPPKGWVHVQRLLVDLFRFMEPYLRNAELGRPIEFLYRGTLRVLLVLLHDFPEFLCDYHFSFCDVIPSSCIQMRNVILSAFPRNMRLPDPSTPNLKIDLLPEIAHSPRIFSDVDAALRAKQQMKSDLDEYIRTRIPPPAFLPDLKAKLVLPPSDAAHAGTRYNVPLINSLVLYVGVQTVVQMPAVGGHSGPMEVYLMGGPAVDIFQTLMVELDTEGRYLFLNAIANQLRYPNIHTHLFSFTLLYLFVEAHQEVIQEQITRVLLERLIVNRPHPWGLLITFMELIKNTRYNFWSRSFTTCAPEIEKLFDSVSRSCGGPKAVDDSAGLPDMR